MRPEIERDLDDELRYHLERQVEQNVAHGMNVDEARTAALRAMGGVERRKDESRDARRVDVVENLVRDLRHGIRSLRRSSGYTVVAVLTLTLGIGANTAIFSAVNGVLLEPLAYQDPDRLVTVSYGRGSTVAAGVFLDWKDASRSFAQMGVEEYWTPNSTGSDKPEQLLGVHITQSMLPMLGVQPELGRIFVPDEGRAGRDRVIVLGYDFWTTRFAADSGVLAKTLTLDGEQYAIIGVMPKGFEFTPYWANTAMFAAPLALDARRQDRAGSSLRSFARLAPGVTLDQARADMRGVSARLEREYPGTNQHVTVTPLREEVVGDVKPALIILLGAVGFVLLIACANVAHLQLVRAASRTRELALRGALGASRARIIQQSLVESGLLAITGGLLGLVLASEGVRLFVSLAPPTIPRVGEITMNGTVLGFAMVATVIAGVVFGAVPAIRAANVRQYDVLKEGGRTAAESPRQRRVRGALIVSEFALALVLLVGAGLLVRSFAALLGVDPGFETRNMLSMQVSVAGTRWEPREKRAQFFNDLIDRVGALPGVQAASAISHVPLNGDDWHFPFAIEGRSLPLPGRSPKAAFLVARPGYFRTMGIRLLRGREFIAEDIAAAAHVVVINASMARHHWPNQSPIGKRISVDDPVTHADWFVIVGVASDVRQSRWTEIDPDQMYFPYIVDSRGAERAMSLASFLHPEYMTLVVRTNVDPAGLTKTIQGLVHTMDRDAPVSSPLTMEQAIARQFATPRFYAFLIGSLACIALLLAGIGVYGVISYSVARRAHEIGVRVALGAERGRVFAMVVGQGVKLAAIGAAIGVVGAFALTRYIGTLLYQIQPTDPLTFGAVALLLTAVAVVACWMPARTALRVAPAEALRAE